MRKRKHRSALQICELNLGPSLPCTDRACRIRHTDVRPVPIDLKLDPDLGSLFQNFLRIPYLRQPFTCLQNPFGERMLLLLPLRRKCAGIFLVGQSSCDDLHALLRLPLSFYL